VEDSPSVRAIFIRVQVNATPPERACTLEERNKREQASPPGACIWKSRSPTMRWPKRPKARAELFPPRPSMYGCGTDGCVTGPEPARSSVLWQSKNTRAWGGTAKDSALCWGSQHPGRPGRDLLWGLFGWTMVTDEKRTLPVMCPHQKRRGLLFIGGIPPAAQSSPAHRALDDYFQAAGRDKSAARRRKLGERYLMPPRKMRESATWRSSPIRRARCLLCQIVTEGLIGILEKCRGTVGT